MEAREYTNDTPVDAVLAAAHLVRAGRRSTHTDRRVCSLVRSPPEIDVYPSSTSASNTNSNGRQTNRKEMGNGLLEM